MRSSIQKSLIKALSACSLRELPEIEDGETVWIKALALVEKVTGEECFVELTKDCDTLSNKVTKDFGGTGAIFKYKSIHPYLYLSSSYMPSFNDRTKDSRIAYLERMKPDTDWSSKGFKELSSAIIGLAIKLQLDSIKSNTIYITEEDGERNVEAETIGNEE